MKPWHIECAKDLEETCNNGVVKYPGQCCQQCGKQPWKVVHVFVYTICYFGVTMQSIYIDLFHEDVQLILISLRHLFWQQFNIFIHLLPTKCPRVALHPFHFRSGVNGQSAAGHVGEADGQG